MGGDQSSTGGEVLAVSGEQFAKRLRRWRRAAGLTQGELARLAGYSVGHLRKLEQGTRRPTRAAALALAVALQLPPEERAQWETATAVRSTARVSAVPLKVPVATTSFVGRAEELAALTSLLQQTDVRLVTLRGPGGVGKTRLMLKAVDGVSSHFPDGICFVSLASLQDYSLLPSALAAALKVQEGERQDTVSVLYQHCAEKDALLIFDTFEHLLPAAAPFVSDLLAHCPTLTIAVTSRSPLHLSAEHELPVDPLPIPGQNDVADLARLSEVPTVALFLQRARAIDPSFTLTEENASAVAEICRRLDGLPLAIELAAAHIRMFSPQALLTRLNRQFELLTGGPYDAPARQQSLWATLDWSYHLLRPEEQRLLARLAVFADGWTLPAAERVCRSNDGASPSLVAGISSLLEQSLVHRERAVGDESRYRMLDTVRAYAFKQLETSDDLFRTQREHAHYYAELAQDASTGLRGGQQETWLRRLETEYPNIRTAIGWSLQYDRETGVRLVTGLCLFWYMRGRLQEGRRWIEEALERSSMDTNHLDPALHAGLLNSAGVLEWQVGEYHRARQLLAGAVTLRRTVGDKAGLSASLTNLGNVLCRVGDFGNGGKLFEESLALGREMGDTWDVAAGLNNLGNVAEAQGDDIRAAKLYSESLALFREIGDTWNAAIALNNLGSVAGRQGDTERAQALLEESLSLFRALNDPWSTANVLSNLSHVVIRAEDFRRGRQLAEESLRLYKEVGDAGQIPEALEALALAVGGLGDRETMTQLLALAASRRESLGVPPVEVRKQELERALTMAQSELEGHRYDAAWATGQTMTLEAAIARATGVDASR